MAKKIFSLKTISTISISILLFIFTYIFSTVYTYAISTQPQPHQISSLSLLSSLSSTYIKLGKSTVSLSRKTVNIYVSGISSFVSVAPRITKDMARITGNFIFDIGSTVTSGIDYSAVAVPQMYLHNIYAIGSSIENIIGSGIATASMLNTDLVHHLHNNH